MLILNFFLVLSFSIIISCCFVVFSTNPIYSLLWLVLSFLFSSSLLLLIGCEFLALVFIVVYVGAIAVLFLFVLMLLDLKIKNLKIKKTKFFLPTVFLGLSFLFSLVGFNSIFVKHNFIFYNFNFVFLEWFARFKNLLFFSFMTEKSGVIFINWKDFANSLNEIEIYSSVLYDIFVLHFLLVGLILLAVLIGVIYLTNTYQSSNVIDQSNFKQISIQSNFFYR